MENDQEKRKTLVDQTVEQLISDISRGKYKIGNKLPNEFELLKEMNISRTCLREAIKILSSMGVLEIRRGDGTYVCSQMMPSTFDHVIYSLISIMSSSDELVELRRILDDMTVRTAIEKITEPEYYKLKNNVKEMEEAFLAGDYERVKKLDYQFHMILIDVCKNKFLIRMIKGVYSIYIKSMNENVSTKKVDTRAVYHHTQILNCIRDKNYNNVRQVIEDSLSSWKTIIEEAR